MKNYKISPTFKTLFQQIKVKLCNYADQTKGRRDFEQRLLWCFSSSIKKYFVEVFKGFDITAGTVYQEVFGTGVYSVRHKLQWNRLSLCGSDICMRT